MNSQASTIIANGYLKGVFDVFDAMMELSFKHEIEDLTEADPDAVQRLLGRHPFVMRAKIPSGGAVALLFSVADVSALAALVMGEGALSKEELDDRDLATLGQMAEPCLGAGLTALMEQFQRDVEQPQEVAVETAGPAAADDLVAFLPPPLVSANFSFSAPPDVNGSGVLLFSQTLEDLVPTGALEAAPVEDLAAQAQLSEAEMSDILSGFSPDETGGAQDMPAEEASSPPAENIDRVLDIRLVATARLGRVQMPLGEILDLGPGSIVDVGRLVDEPVELLVNEKLIARGDVVVVDERFGLRITEIVSPEQRIESMH